MNLELLHSNSPLLAIAPPILLAVLLMKVTLFNVSFPEENIAPPMSEFPLTRNKLFIVMFPPVIRNIFLGYFHLLNAHFHQ